LQGAPYAAILPTTEGKIMWTILWTFRTRNFCVTLECEPERDSDLSWADSETLDKLERGIYENVTFRVRVLYRGATFGAEYLCNSVYEHVEDFRKEHIGARGQHGYFVDMMHTAIDETRVAFLKAPRMREEARQ
jgi:hypothetical protein